MPKQLPFFLAIACIASVMSTTAGAENRDRHCHVRLDLLVDEVERALFGQTLDDRYGGSDNHVRRPRPDDCPRDPFEPSGTGEGGTKDDQGHNRQEGNPPEDPAPPPSAEPAAPGGSPDEPASPGESETPADRETAEPAPDDPSGPGEEDGSSDPSTWL